MLQQVQLEKITHKDRGGLRLRETGNKKPLVSVVCVTYNAAKTLPSLIKSISDHKTRSVEFIVVDGNSTDGTVDILKENEDVIDFWISKPDNGIYDAMNRAVNYIKGKWVIFLGADDLLLDGFNKMITLLKDNNTIYYGNLLFYGKEFLKVYDDYYLTKLNICHQAIFYPKAVFNQYNYDLQYRVYADYHLNLRCWNDPKFNFVHADHFISHFREGGFSGITKDEVFESNKDMLFKKYLKPSSYYRYLNRTLGFFGMFVRFVQNK
jgi:glycosyltransferase involved in cell wall biosynthesis